MVFIEITIFFIMRSLFSYHNIIMYHADIHIIKYWSPCRNKKDKKDKAHHDDDFFHGQSPLGFRADRYRSFPHNHHLHEEEVYDEIKDENRTSKVSNLNYRNGPQNNGNIGSYSKDEYLTPSFAGENGQDSYLTPVSLHDKDSSDYTVLPAVTLPIDQITAKYNSGGGDTMNQENGEYVEPKDLNMPKHVAKRSPSVIRVKLFILTSANIVDMQMRIWLTDLTRHYLQLGLNADQVKRIIYVTICLGKFSVG